MHYPAQKNAGGPADLPDFAWHPECLVNPDRLCHVVRTSTTQARYHKVNIPAQLAEGTKKLYQNFRTENALNEVMVKLQQNSYSEE